MCLNYLNNRHKLDMPPLMGKTHFVTKGAGLMPCNRAQNDKERSISEKDEEKMVGRIGFEPMTNWLKANCSTD